MATHEAVAAVGLTLQLLLADRVESGNGGPPVVSLGPPGPARDPLGGAEDPRINLFLYQVSENGALKNQDLPGRGSPGAFGQPPISLDLSFLLTVFGLEARGEFFDETPAHRLLGSAMNVLSDHAIITESIVTQRPPIGLPVLDPVLRGEREHIKLTLNPLGLEELTNVWTALELSYRLSTAYEVSVVQIESSRPRRHPRLVGEPPAAGPHVFTVPLRRPSLDVVAVRRQGEPAGSERTIAYARVGDTLILRGAGFAGELLVRLGELAVTPPAAGVSALQIEIVVPDDALPDGTLIDAADRIRPGTHLIEVAAVPPDLPAVASGRMAFVLTPGVTGANVAGRVLTISGTRLLDDSGTGQVIVGDAVVERRAYRGDSTDTQLRVTVPATLPVADAAATVSGALEPFPTIGVASREVTVTLGAGSPEVITLPETPTTLAGAAAALRSAFRAAGEPALRNIEVANTDRSLVVVADDLSSAITFTAGSMADELRLSGDAMPADAYLSGRLAPFPELTSAPPSIDVTIGATTATAHVGVISPATVAAAAGAVDAAIREADGDPAFTGARVAALGSRLCILPGTPSTVSITSNAADTTTAAELELAGTYDVRVRVNGVESIDPATLGLPQ